MKAIKKLFKVLLIVVGIFAVLVLALPLWIGPVVKGIANSAVPKITKTGFHMGGFGLNPYSGCVSIDDVRLQNPERFFTSSQKSAEAGESALGAVARVAGNAVAAVGDAVTSSETNALSFSEINVNLAMLSLPADTLRIEEIVVRDLNIYGDLTFSNIREIADNASGGEKPGAAAEEAGADAKSEESGDAEKGGKKVVIDRVFITGTKFQWGHVVVPIPDIEIKDIGKDEAVDEAGAFDRVVDALCDAADKAQTGLGTALKAAINGGKAVGRVVGDAAGAIGDAVGAVGDAAGAVGDTAGKTASAVGDVAGKTVEAVGDVAGKTVEAIGDAAGKTVDAVKGVFN